MSFAQVLFLLGAAGVVGPIMAHLLAKPRYRRVPFTMLAFLQVGTRDVETRRKLRNLLLLILRMAIIVTIALLFAGPLLLKEPVLEEVTTAHYLGLDDSASMACRDGSQTLFEKMIGEARGIVEASDEKTEFNISLLASGQRQRGLSKGAALAQLARLETVPLVAGVDEFVAELKAAESRRSSRLSVKATLISDFTPSFLDSLSGVEEQALVDDVEYIALSTGAADNVSITDVRLVSATRRAVILEVILANYGDGLRSRVLVASIDGRRLAESEATVDARSRDTVRIEVPLAVKAEAADIIPIELLLEGGDALEADDHYYIAVATPEETRMRVVVCGASARETFLVRSALEALSTAESFETLSVLEETYSAFRPSVLAAADVAVFAGPSDVLLSVADPLLSFVRRGGKAFFFLSSEGDAAVYETLSGQGILPAVPGRLRRERATLDPVSHGADALEAVMASADCGGLEAYRMETVILTGYFECSPAAEAECPWRFSNGQGFFHARRIGNGVSVLVNTSADDSLGTLMRSPAAVAFCRFLVGQKSTAATYAFACGEVLSLPATDDEADLASAGRPVWVVTPSGSSQEAGVSAGEVVAVVSDATGWALTPAKPVRRAGINLPKGETDITAPDEAQVALMSARALRKVEKHEVAGSEEGGRPTEATPIWWYFAWAAVAMILFEAFVANRTQR